MWSKANWSGVMYATHNNHHNEPPTMALMFMDGDAGRAIFQRWKTEYNQEISKKLRITVVKGINHEQPYWYTVIIGSVINKNEVNENTLTFFASKTCTMTATKPDNLKRFEDALHSTRACILVPALFMTNLDKPQAFYDAAVVCRHIEIKEAWTIGLNDMDSVAINEFKPVIPEGITNAPVLQILSKKQFFAKE